MRRGDLPPRLPTSLPRHPSAATPCPARRRIGQTLLRGRGSLDPLPVGCASRPRLRVRLTPGGLTFPGNPWAFGARAFHPRFRILMPAFSFPMPPAAVACRLPGPTGRSPTTLRSRAKSTASAARLAPIILGAAGHRPVSCYAFFKGWLLLSQPPGCPSPATSFLT